MPKYHLAKRSSIDWAVRVALALAIVIIGYVAVTRSIAEIMNKSDPQRAHFMAITDGRVTAALSERIFQDQRSGSINSPSAKLARLAVRQDATAVSAIVILATQAQMRGDLDEARRLFGYAETLSRRSLPTQLWAIEDAVSRGDIPGALRHYDIALRASRSASTILYPILTAALAEPAIRSNLTETMLKKPAWAASFLAYALSSSIDPRHIASLFADMHSAGIPLAPEASSSLINRLLLVNAPDQAWRYYTSLRKGMVRDRLRDGNFTTNPVSSSSFDWMVEDGNGLTVSIQQNEQGGIVDFSVPTGHDGVLLKQVQILPPGTYQLSGTGSGINQPDMSLPYWTLICRNGPELGRVVLNRSKEDISTFSGRFDVPPGCPVQTLALVARPSNSFAGITGRINHVELKPVI